MRMIYALALLVAACLGTQRTAAAEEPAEPQAPIWSVENVMPTAEQAPKGWKVRTVDEGPSGLSYSAMEAVGEGLGLGEDSYYVEFRVFESEQGKCGVAMIDADASADRVRAALDTQAAAGNWSVHIIGTPMRLLVVSGEPALRDALARTLLGDAIYTFCDLARNRLNAGRGKDETLTAVQEYVRVIRGLDPEAGVSYSLEAGLHIQRGGKDPKKPDWIEWDQAIAGLRRALTSGVAFPPTGKHRFWAASRLGGLLLDKEQDGLLDEAIQALQMALESESDAPDAAQRVDTRFWLTRAHARKGPSDVSFQELRTTLDFGKTLLPPQNYKWLYEQVKEKDTAFGKLRQDPRFSQLMSEFAPPEPKKPADHPPTK